MNVCSLCKQEVLCKQFSKCHFMFSVNNITAFTSWRTNLSPFTKGCREWDASMWLPEFLRTLWGPTIFPQKKRGQVGLHFSCSFFSRKISERTTTDNKCENLISIGCVARPSRGGVPQLYLSTAGGPWFLRSCGLWGSSPGLFEADRLMSLCNYRWAMGGEEFWCKKPSEQTSFCQSVVFLLFFLCVPGCLHHGCWMHCLTFVFWVPLDSRCTIVFCLWCRCNGYPLQLSYSSLSCSTHCFVVLSINSSVYFSFHF